MKSYIQKILLIISVALFVFTADGQTRRSPVTERDVRAQMQFLAGDAMQGRGSGSQFERIAAEYIGSQFMQFGLEPAGEAGWDGKPTYVQTVDVPGRSVIKDLTMTDGSGDRYIGGKDLAAYSIGGATVSGDLLKLKAGGSATRGAVVLYDAGREEKMSTLQPAVTKFYREGAAAVLITFTDEIGERWSDVASRDPMISRRGTMIVLSASASDALRKAADGTRITISGTAVQGPATHTWNAMGKITGSDRTLGSEVILITSHLDHLGVRDTAPGDDKTFNGADDDASGTVAVLELARVLAAAKKKPERTVYFVCFGSEEAGGFGAGYFVNHMPFPQEKLIANLEFEMIGRPDPKVRPEELWLTGYERSDLGPELARRGAKLVQDPHPEQNFFQRSDNIQLARRGIIAHTVSSFGLHTDYHQVSDEVRTIDFDHMTRAINSMVVPITWLVNSKFRPKWNEGMKP